MILRVSVLLLLWGTYLSDAFVPQHYHPSSRGSAAAAAISTLRMAAVPPRGTTMGWKSKLSSPFQKFQKNQRQRSASAPLAMSTADGALVNGEDAPQTTKNLFSKLANLLPPKQERQKLVPLALMFFCILFNYTILRDTKDVLMVTAPKSGAEVIPFIKTYCNLPVAIVSICILKIVCVNGRIDLEENDDASALQSLAHNNCMFQHH